MMKILFNIHIASTRWKAAFPKMRAKIEQAAAVAFLQAKKPGNFKVRVFEINILLTDDATIKKLNHDFRGRKKATNVLSFPQIKSASSRKQEPLSLGDIALAYQTIKKECRAQRKPLENHTLHLIVHGVLHLIGYDHKRLKDAKAMEKLECDILASLGYPDPYHDIITKKAGR